MLSVSDIKSAAAQAACFTCLPVNVQRAIKTYLLARVAGASTDPKTIMAAARGFIGLPPGTQLAIQAYAASVLSGAASASAFVKSQACAFECTPASMALPIAINQLAGRAGVSPVPKTLAALAKSFIGLPPGYLSALNTFLMAVIAGISVDAATAAKQAACFTCIPPANLENITTLIWTNVALPAPLDFSVVVNPDGSVDVTWGTPPTGTAYTAVYISFACDYNFVLYANVAAPGTTIHIPGIFGLTPGICIEIRSCTAAGLCSPPVGTGTEGGGSGGGGSLTLLTGFSFVPSSNGLSGAAAWDAPPIGVTGTELWTSSDGITYALASTTAAPGTSATVAAPAVGSFLFAKARWVNATVQGTFCAAQEVSGRVCDWVKRVIANGGSAPTLTERTATNTFDLALVAGGLDSLMISNILVISSSVIGALTPLYKSKGLDPYTNHNFVIGDLTVNGMVGDGATKFASTGMGACLDFPALGDGGITAYTTTFVATSTRETGAADVGSVGAILNSCDGVAGTTSALMWSTGAGGIASGANPNWKGYTSVNRTANNNLSIYIASSGTVHAKIAQNVNAEVNFASNLPMYAWAWNNNGATANFSDRRISYLGYHHGLTQAQSLTHFNAVQAFRTSLGGGFI